MAELSESEPETIETKSSKKWLWVLLIVTLLLAGAGGYWYFFSKNNTTHSTEADSKLEADAEQSKPPVFVELESFTVNLQPNDQFLQATFNLQVSDEKEVAAIKMYMPQIRSRLLMLLSNKTAENLAKQEGKTLLISEIESLIEQPFTKGAEPIKIINVFLTSFIIQ